MNNTYTNHSVENLQNTDKNKTGKFDVTAPEVDNFQTESMRKTAFKYMYCRMFCR